MPAKPHVSSLSDESPVTPTAPIVSPSAPTIMLPPAAGTIPLGASTRREAKKDGRSVAMSAILRLDIPIPRAPLALAIAICGRSDDAPSCQARSTISPPASRTATVSGLSVSSAAFANAISTMVRAWFNVMLVMLISLIVLVMFCQDYRRAARQMRRPRAMSCANELPPIAPLLNRLARWPRLQHPDVRRLVSVRQSDCGRQDPVRNLRS